MKADDTSGKMAVLISAFIFVLCTHEVLSGQSDRILLKEISVLTLYNGRYTAGRRSSPVPQLACVGGSAKGYFTPEVVQCYNRGSDGIDIQWECKTDMDKAYRFGKVEVTCEGYDYPDDPFILKGSCGLEYSLELTEEGRKQHQQKSSYYSESHHQPQGSSHNGNKKSGESVIYNVIFLGGVALVIYIVYKTCLSNNTSDEDRTPPRAPQGDHPPPYSPPQYGFRDEYMPGGCSGSSTYPGSSDTGTGAGTGTQGGGFWTGAATGGLLGYLFGRNNGYGSGYTQYQQPYYSPWGPSAYARPRNTGGWFSGGGSTGSSFTGGSGGLGGFSSSGTRTASGFGGTKRR